MKKNLLLTCFLFLCFFFLIACNHENNYRTDAYEYIPNYKNATCTIAKRKQVELHVEHAAESSKEEIFDLLNILYSDYSSLKMAFGLDTPIKCYVIADDFLLEKDEAIYQNEILLCGKNSIRSGQHRQALTAAYIRSTEAWKQYAASAYVFHNEYDNYSLKQYYSNGNDLKLTLFFAYFCRDFSDTVDIAIQTAYSLGEFIIKNYGYEEFITSNLTSYRNEYLCFLGLDKTLDIPFDLSWLDGAEYDRKNSSYSLVIKTQNRTYYLNAFSSERDTASFDTPERVLYHLSAGVTECNRILDYMKDNAPGSYEFVSKRYDEHLTYFIFDGESKTRCDVNRKKIYLLDPSEYVHETIHAVTLQGNPSDEAWLGEGVAEYLSRRISKHTSDIHYRFYLSFTDKNLAEDIADFANAVCSLYERKGGTFESLSDFDLALLEKCIGEITLKNSDYKSRIQFPYATTPIYKTYSCTSKDGNVLTYAEAFALTSYLIEKYGFDRVLQCCIHYDPMFILGSDYNDLMKDYIESIS